MQKICKIIGTFCFQYSNSTSCYGDSGSPLVRYTQFSDGSSYMRLVGVVHGSHERCTSTTVNYPGLFANVEHCDILSFIHKWKTLDDLFDMAKEKNETALQSIFKQMTHLNPVDENGIKLSQHFSPNANGEFNQIISRLCYKFANRMKWRFYDEYSIPCESKSHSSCLKIQNSTLSLFQPLDSSL